MDLHDCASMCDVCDETKYIPKYRIEFRSCVIIINVYPRIEFDSFLWKGQTITDAVSILLMVVGTVISPFTHIVSLLGVLDLELT